jgi:uncharacterized protein (TIGR03435 family)
VVADGGPKLQVSKLDASQVPPQGTPTEELAEMLNVPIDNRMLILLQEKGATERTDVAHSLSILAAVLRSALGVPVVDKTGLTGRYDIHYPDFVPTSRLAPAAQRDARIPGAYADMPSLRDGLAKLGLALEVKKTPVGVLVVDHVESLPARR